MFVLGEGDVAAFVKNKATLVPEGACVTAKVRIAVVADKGDPCRPQGVPGSESGHSRAQHRDWRHSELPQSSETLRPSSRNLVEGSRPITKTRMSGPSLSGRHLIDVASWMSSI